LLYVLQPSSGTGGFFGFADQHLAAHWLAVAAVCAVAAACLLDAWRVRRASPEGGPQPVSYARRGRPAMPQLVEEKRNWEEFAAQDPFWAVLAQPDRKYGRWEREDFYRTGEAQIAEVMDHAAQFDRPQRREAALDFGSGVGRLTR